MSAHLKVFIGTDQIITLRVYIRQAYIFGSGDLIADWPTSRQPALHVLLHGGVLLLQPIDFIGENWSDFHHNPQVRDLKRAAGEFGAG